MVLGLQEVVLEFGVGWWSWGPKEWGGGVWAPQAVLVGPGVPWWWAGGPGAEAVLPQDLSSAFFYLLEFAKTGPPRGRPAPGLRLRPCLYKRR